MNIQEIISKNSSAKIDIGCGEKKQPGFVGMDYRPMKGVDIVHNVEEFPWPIPDNTFDMALTSHLLEHIKPTPPDALTTKLIDILLKKKLITKKEIGEHAPGLIFMRFMDEVWRILKPGAQFMSTFPHADSFGYRQDPTHINMINQATWAYFDPLHPSRLYAIYKPKPWKIVANLWNINGNCELVLEKRLEDKSYAKLTY